MSIVDHLTCSPGTAGLSLEDSLRVFSGIGFRNIELFSRAGGVRAVGGAGRGRVAPPSGRGEVARGGQGRRVQTGGGAHRVQYRA